MKQKPSSGMGMFSISANDPMLGKIVNAVQPLFPEETPFADVGFHILNLGVSILTFHGMPPKQISEIAMAIAGLHLLEHGPTKHSMGAEFQMVKLEDLK